MRIRHSTLTAGAIFALSLAGAAQAQDFGQPMLILEQLDSPHDKEIAVKAGERITGVKLFAPFAVRLDGGVDLSPELAAKASIEPGVPLEAGTVLTATEPGARRYCLPMRATGLGLSGPCLIDSDGDGRFEGVQKAGFTSARAEGISISRKGEAVGTRYWPVATLASPVGYTKLRYQAGKAGLGTLRWSGRASKARGRPVPIAFSIGFARGEGPVSQPVQFTFAGEPMTIDIYGIGVRVLGFDENKALRLRVESFRSGERVPLLFRDRTPLPLTFHY